MKCKKCKSESKDDSLFCYNCGSKLSKSNNGKIVAQIGIGLLVILSLIIYIVKDSAIGENIGNSIENVFVVSNKLNVEISEINIGNYPEISIKINKLSDDSNFSVDNINLYDNENNIERFEIEENNSGWLLKYINPINIKEAMARRIRIENKNDDEDIVLGQYEKKEQKEITLKITQVDSNDYPNVNIYFMAEDVNGNTITDLNINNINLSEQEGGVKVVKALNNLKFVENSENISVNMVFDKSGSMSSMIEQCKNTAINFLNSINLDYGDKVEIIEFNEQPKINNYFTSNKESLINSISSMKVSGETALYDSLIMSLNETNLQDGAKCIIAFTDGLDNSSVSTSNDVIKLSKTLGIPIYIIGFGENIDLNNLTEIGDSTGGRFVNIYDIGELEDIYSNILRTTKNQYVLEYMLNEETSDIVNRDIDLYVESFNYIGNLKSEFEIKPEEYRVNIEEYNNMLTSIEDKSNSIFSEIQGNYSLAFKDLTQSNTLSVNSEKTIAASVIKIYIMIEAYNQVYNGDISLDKVITLKDSMKAEGSGILRTKEEGSSYTIKELIELMMIKSDNTAANMIIDLVGMNKINERIKALGCIDTELNRKMMDQNAIDNGIENYTSVDDLTLTFSKLYNGQCISKEYDSYIIDIMKNNENDNKISNQLPNEVEVSDKTGEYPGVENDAGIVFTDKGTYIICVMTKDGVADEEINAISDTSKYIYDEYIKYKK